MSMIKVEAYKCEWCGQVFPQPSSHEFECKHDPKSRTCVSCAYSHELKGDYRNDGSKKALGVYCPRAEQIFIYPHDKYCADYKKEPRFESLAEKT